MTARVNQSVVKTLISLTPPNTDAHVNQAFIKTLVRTYKIEAPAETGFAFDAPGHVDREQIPVMGSFDFED